MRYYCHSLDFVFLVSVLFAAPKGDSNTNDDEKTSYNKYPDPNSLEFADSWFWFFVTSFVEESFVGEWAHIITEDVCLKVGSSSDNVIGVSFAVWILYFAEINLHCGWSFSIFYVLIGDCRLESSVVRQVLKVSEVEVDLPVAFVTKTKGCFVVLRYLGEWDELWLFDDVSVLVAHFLSWHFNESSLVDLSAVDVELYSIWLSKVQEVAWTVSWYRV